MLEKIKNEPVLLTALVSAVLALAVAFGLHLSKEQTAAILAVVNAGLALVVRSKVTPTRK